MAPPLPLLACAAMAREGVCTADRAAHGRPVAVLVKTPHATRQSSEPSLSARRS